MRITIGMVVRMALLTEVVSTAAGQEPRQMAGLVPPNKDYAQVYVQPFKGSTARPPGWDPEGPSQALCVQHELAGLRIKVPVGFESNRKGVGLISTFGVKGDFEITMSFEVLQPDDDAQTGTALRLAIDRETPKPNTATFSRSARGTIVTWYALWREEAAKPDPPRSNIFPVQSKSGRLRYVRSGSDLYYALAEGADEEFTVKSKYSFGAEDLRAIRIIGVTGNETATLDMRLSDFCIRADAIPNAPASAGPPPVQVAPPQPPRKGSLAAVLAGGVAFGVLLAFGLGVWLFISRRRLAANHPGQADPSEVDRDLA
jgi:hypothetical protein